MMKAIASYLNCLSGCLQMGTEPPLSSRTFSSSAAELVVGDCIEPKVVFTYQCASRWIKIATSSATVDVQG